MNVSKLRVGAIFHFVEDGTTYGDPVNTVSALLFPNADTDPEPWQANPMGCVIDSQIKPSFTEDADECYTDHGYQEVIDRRLKQLLIGLSLKAHSELLHRLIWMLPAKIADETAQTPFIGPDYVEGWAHLQLEDDDQVAIYTGVVRCRMRLDENPKWSKDPSKPAVTLEVFFRNPLNTLLPDNIIGA
jgi:hypothetical protein